MEKINFKKGKSSLSEALDISEEQNEQVKKYVFKEMQNDVQISASLKSICESDMEENEKVFAIFMFGRMLGEAKSQFILKTILEKMEEQQKILLSLMRT